MASPRFLPRPRPCVSLTPHLVRPPLLLALLVVLLASAAAKFREGPGRVGRNRDSIPQNPSPWPDQFHAVLFQNRSARLALVDLWYDWPGGRNLNLIKSQLGRTLYDVEWSNKTSFYFDREAGTCRTVTFDVGILWPTWLHGATYLGTELVDGSFFCHVWTKADFIQYYEDSKTGQPVKWIFLESGAVFHVLRFEPGAASESEDLWQAPDFCFSTPSSIKAEPAVRLEALVGITKPFRLQR